MDALFFAFDIVESTRGTAQSVRRAAAVHFELDRRLELPWLRDRILKLPRADIWQTLARSALRDELYKSHRTLTSAVLETCPSSSIDSNVAIDGWLTANHAQVERYLETVAEIRSAPASGFMTLFVAIQELASVTGAPPL